MRLKPKTVRRLTLLAALGCVLLIAAFSLVFVRKWQGQRLTEGFRARALAAQQERDYYKTIENAGSYLKRGDQRDPDILLAYAEARLNLREADGRHLRDATQFYERYLEVRPDDAEARRVLLETYNRCAFFPEAAALARSMRPDDLNEATRAHIFVLEQEALALVGSSRFESADQVIARLFELEPLNPYAALLRVDRVARGDVNLRTLPSLQQWASEYLDAHPDEPVALLAAASTQMLARNELDAPRIRSLVAKAAGLELDDRGNVAHARPGAYTSPVVAEQIVEILDRMRAHDAAVAALRDAVDRIDDPNLRVQLVRRLWQDSAMAEVVRRTDDLTPASHEADPVLLGFRALSLAALGRIDDAKAIAAAMEAREGDFRLSSWAAALPLAWAEPSADLRERVTKLRAIVKDNPTEPVFHLWLGDTLAALARQDEALTAWREASRLHDGRHWVFPRIRRGEALLRANRLDEAAEEATEAFRIAPNRAVVATLFFEIQAARLQRGLSTTQPPRQLAEHATRFDQDLANIERSEQLDQMRERLIAPMLIFLSHGGERERASAMGREVLESERPLSQSAIERIAMANTVERLGLEDLVAKRAASLKGGSPTVQYSRALDLAVSGRVADGRDLLQAEVNARPGETGPRIALGRFLERTGDNNAALAVWRELGDRFPDDLNAQRACLESNAIASDSKFLEATISRYEALAGIETGGEDSASRMARARALMYGAPTARDRDRAVGMLASVIAQQPRLVEAKRLLASALMYSDPSRNIRPDFPRAVSALTDAITIEPTNTAVALELAALLQLQGRFDAARAHLNPIASDQGLDLLTRRHAAEMLIRQGDLAPVADRTLEEIAAKLGDQTPASVLVALATIHENRGKTADAHAIFERLAAGGAGDTESLFMTARHYARAGQTDRVEELLRKAADLPGASPATEQLIRARLASERGDFERAQSAFESAAAADPKLADVWLQYAGMLVRLRDYDSAVAVAERGLKEIPGERSLSVIMEHTTLLRDEDADPEIAGLARSLAATGSASESRDILAAVREVKSRGETENPEALARLSDRFPRSVPLQMWAVARMIQINETRGIALLRRALDANPADPNLARFGAELYVQRRQWGELLSTATTWRDRDGSRSPEPDLAIARAHLELRQFDRGLSALSRWVAGAATEPEALGHRDILNMRAKLLIGAGRADEAFRELAPAMEQSRAVRIDSMLLAATDFADHGAARAWLSRVMAVSAQDSIEEQLGAATTFSFLSQRFPREPSFLEECKAILQRLAERADATGLVWESLGIVLHRESDLPGAEAAYRKAIALDPSRVGALNNLAYMLSESDLDTAMEYAQRAVAAGTPQHPNHPDHLDTLAGIHTRRAKRLEGAQAAEEHRAAARAYMDAALLRPQDHEKLLLAAESATRAGEPGLAIEALERALRFRLPDELTAQIRNNLAALRLKRNATGDAVRAREEANAAVRFQERAAFLGTLGWAHLACAEPKEAEAAFRRALGLNQTQDPTVSAKIGLAMALMADAAGLQEAGAILAELDGSDLPPDDAERLSAAREKLRTR
jgi:tetratricopeptide (TPR) repeat protein